MELSSLSIVVGILVVPVLVRHLHRRWHAYRLESGLRDLLDRVTIAGVQERLARGPLVVRRGTGHDWQGDYILLTHAGVGMRLRLYRPPAGGTRAAVAGPVRLRTLRYVDGLGWVVAVESHDGVLRHVGWHLQVEHGPVTTARDSRT